MNVKNIINSIFFPDKGVCIFCGAEKGVVHAACENCGKELNALKMKPCKGSIGYIPFAAVYHYDGIVKHPILDLKYHGAKWKAKYMAEEMYEILVESGFEFDCITYVPMTRRKEKKRGYNQAKELAACISEKTGKPLRNLLVKTKETETQTKLSAAERAKNVKGVFEKGDTLSEKRVLLIDDVSTTGATVSECAKVLRKMGAESIRVLVYAKD